MSEQFTVSMRIRVEPELNAAIRDRARAEKTSASEMLRRALRDLVRSRPLTSPVGEQTIR